MRFNKLFIAFTALLLTLLLVSCGGGSEFYYASEVPTENSEWVYYVVVEKKGSKIVDAKWSAFHIEGNLAGYEGKDKYQASKDGLYNLPKNALSWADQADLLIAKLIETQDYNDQTPTPAGATIDNTPFYRLVEQALASEKVEKGKFVDGHYVFEGTKTDRAEARVWDPVAEEIVTVPGFKYFDFGIFNVVNGTIVEAYFNAAFNGYRYQMDNTGKIIKHTEGEASYSVIQSDVLYKTKNQLGLSYGMKRPNGPGSFEYFEAAKSFGEYLIANQKNPLPELNTDGGTDAISGVTITATGFYEAVDQIPKK